MDGNFKAEHLHMRNPADDVSISDGHGFMVGSKAYGEHLKMGIETPEVSAFFVLWRCAN